METVASVIASIWRRDIMFLIDMKDAYFHFLMHLESKPCPCFMVNERIHQFKALYFTLFTASQVFTRVFFLISKWAHQRD